MSHVNVSAAEVRSALRVVLRAIDRHLTHINGNRQWRKEIIARFRAGTHRQSMAHEGSAAAAQASSAEATPKPQPSVPTTSQHLTTAAGTDARPSTSSRPISPAGQSPSPAQALVLAREWAELANNIARHKELLLTYNIGLDVDERTKRMVEATARRVGFALPDNGKN